MANLRRCSSQTLRAVHAETGEPLQDFAVKVEHLWPSGSWRQVQEPAVSSAGKNPEPLTVSIRPGERFGMFSEGFCEVIQVLDQTEHGVLDIPMQPIRRIEGRVLQDGQPAAGVILELVAGQSTEPYRGLADMDRGPYFIPEPGCKRWALTHGQGNFSLQAFELQQPVYWLRANQDTDLAAQAWFELDPADTGPLQLADLHLQETGSVRGKVIVPAGFVTAGLGVSMDSDDATLGDNVDRDGHFLIRGVLPGQHNVVIEHVGEIQVGEAMHMVDVAAGQTSEFLLDLSEFGIAFRSLELTEGGKPLASQYVFLTAPGHVPEGGLPSETVLDKHFFGTTGPQGMVRGSAPCGPAAELWTLDQDTDEIRRHPSARIPLDCKPVPRIPVEFRSDSALVSKR